MKTVLGVRRDCEDALKLLVKGSDDSFELVDLATLTVGRRPPGLERFECSVRVRDLKRIRGLAVGADLAPRGESFDSAVAYVLQTGDGSIAIPSHLLVLALFGSNRWLRKCLLLPHGQEVLAEKVVNRRGPALVQVRLRLGWVASDPSIRKAWSSIYANALNGRFDVDLPPELLLHITAHATRRDGQLVASSIQVALTESLESTGASITAAGQVVPAAPPPAAGKVCLTDEQWAKVSPVVFAALRRTPEVKPDSRRKHSIRDIVDQALAEHLRHTPWRYGSDIASNYGQYIDSLLRTRGAWREIYKLLRWPDCSGRKTRLGGTW